MFKRSFTKIGEPHMRNTKTLRTPKPQPEWARRGTRAIPLVTTPKLRALEVDVMRNLGRVRAIIITRPLVALVGFCLAATQGWWILTPVQLWVLYGSTCSAVHHLMHSGMGMSPRVRHFWLTTLGLVIAESGHAWFATHAMHHRDGTDLPDPEGYLEYLSWRELPAGAMKWRLRMMSWGYRFGQRQRRTRAELVTIVAMHITALALTPITVVPIVYLALMQAGSFLFACMLAKGPQTNFGRQTTTPLIMVKTTLIGLFLFNHHRHLEHHLYPKVPIARLGELTPTVEAALANEDVLHIELAV